MESYDDENCECHKLEKSINDEYPECNWNLDAACKAWGERSANLKDNDIECEPYADECYGCTCPTCGRLVCGWCI